MLFIQNRGDSDDDVADLPLSSRTVSPDKAIPDSTSPGKYDGSHLAADIHDSGETPEDDLQGSGQVCHTVRIISKVAFR